MTGIDLPHLHICQSGLFYEHNWATEALDFVIFFRIYIQLSIRFVCNSAPPTIGETLSDTSIFLEEQLYHSNSYIENCKCAFIVLWSWWVAFMLEERENHAVKQCSLVLFTIAHRTHISISWIEDCLMLVRFMQVVVKVALVNMLFLFTILVVAHVLPKIGPYAKMK